MLRRLRPLLSATVKRTTGITGYPVVPNARAVLISLLEKTLEEIKGIPEEAGYRKGITAITQWRLDVARAEEDVAEIEREIQCGQIEELIEQAEEELGVLYMMRDDPDKLWEIPPEGLPKIYIRTHEVLQELTEEELAAERERGGRPPLVEDGPKK